MTHVGLFSFSIQHQQHGLEQVAKAASILPDFLTLLDNPPENVDSPICQLAQSIQGRLILSTCNRVELMLDCDNNNQPVIGQEIQETLNQYFGSIGEFREGKNAITHIYQVAAGLDSMVVGEREISGQIRRALTVAQQEQTASHLITRVCQGALSTSRKIAHLTGLASQGRSVVACALELVKAKYIPSLEGASVLLMGTGSYAGATVAALRSQGVEEIYAHSSSGRAQRFAQGHDLTAITNDQLVSTLAQVDLVVTCRGLGTPILHHEQVLSSLGQRLLPGRQLVLLDLSLQADIESSISKLPGVYLIDLPQVQRAVPEASRKQLARAQALVQEAVAEILVELQDRAMDPVVIALRDRYQQIVAEEIARLPQTDMINVADVQHALRRLAARLAHAPTVNARRAARQGQANQFISALGQVLGVEIDLGKDYSSGTCPVTGLDLEHLAGASAKK